MSFGDNKLSENGASGHVEGTAADLFIRCNFNPQTVIVTNMDNGAQLYWTQTMAQGSGVITNPGGPSSLVTQTDNGAMTFWRIYYGGLVGGPFQIGETVTDTLTLGTGIVSGLGTNRFGFDYLDFSGIGGSMGNNNGLSGGTSGAAATSTSVLVARVTPTAVPVAMMGASVNNSGTDFDALRGVVIAANNTRIKSSDIGKYDDVENVFELARDYSGGLRANRYGISYLRAATSGGNTPIIAGGITTGTAGFSIGNDPTVNILGNNLYWFALR